MVRVVVEEEESGRGTVSADSSERAGLTDLSPALPDERLLSPADDLVFREKRERMPRLFLSSAWWAEPAEEEIAAIVMRSVTERGGALKSLGTTLTSWSW